MHTTSIFLSVSVAALAAGPLVHHLVRSMRSAISGLDGFNFVAITGLVLLHGLPDAFDRAGIVALAAVVIGFIGPTLFERWRHHIAKKAHATALVLALAGLAAHAFIDGTVIALNITPLSLAVILHRLPVSLTIWMMLLGRQRHGLRAAVLAAMGAATVFGYYVGSAVAGGAGYGIGLFEGLVSGSLLHVVFHRPATGGEWAGHPDYPAGLGALLGIGLLVGAEVLTRGSGHTHGLGSADAASVFVALAARSAPALLLAYLGAGLLDVFMPKATVAWMQRGTSFSQSLRGVGFGLPLPVCSCGVIPLYRSLIVKGAPAAAAMAFLVATPEIGIDAVLLSIPLLGTELTIVRVACAAVVAIVSGWIVGRVAQSLHPGAQKHAVASTTASAPIGRRIAAAIRSGYGEVVDNTGPWILLGLGIAAIGADLIDSTWIGHLPTTLGVVLFALAGIPTYVCATGATPLVTMLIFKGVSPGAAVAFLLTGPATNATTFGVLSRLHGHKTALLFGVCVATMAILLGFVVNQVLPHPNVFPLTGEHVHEHLGWLLTAALFGLAAVFAASLLRQGPRRFISHVIALHGAEDDSNEQGGGNCAQEGSGGLDVPARSCCGEPSQAGS